MDKIYFVPYNGPWCGDWFFEDLKRLSVYDWEKISLKDSSKLKNSLIVFWNYQNISHYKILFLRKLKRYKEKHNMIIAGVRGSRTLEKYGRLLNMFDGLLSNYDIKNLNQYADPFKIHYAPDGINSKKFYNLDINKPKDLVITWIGRKNKKYKNYDMIPKMGYPYKVANGIPYGLMYKFYNSGNVYVLTSNSEGYGRGLVESALCGSAIVTSNVGVAPLIVDPDYIINGNPSDKIEEYKEALKHFEDPDLRSRIGQENRLRALEFDINKIIPMWDKVLRRYI